MCGSAHVHISHSTVHAFTAHIQQLKDPLRALNNALTLSGGGSGIRISRPAVSYECSKLGHRVRGYGGSLALFTHSLCECVNMRFYERVCCACVCGVSQILHISRVCAWVITKYVFAFTSAWISPNLKNFLRCPQVRIGCCTHHKLPQHNTYNVPKVTSYNWVQYSWLAVNICDVSAMFLWLLLCALVCDCGICMMWCMCVVLLNRWYVPKLYTSDFSEYSLPFITSGAIWRIIG